MDTLRGNQYGVAANPNNIKRPNMGNFPMINAIGSRRQTTAVDKLASKADVIIAKIAAIGRDQLKKRNMEMMGL